MYNTLINIKKYGLLLGDIVILYLSLYLTLMVRYAEQPSELLWKQHFWPFTALFALWLIIFYINNLYDLSLAVNNFKFFARTSRALIISFLLGTAFFYLIPRIDITPKRNLLICIVITAILFLLWRQIYNLILKSYLPKNKIAVIGLNEQVKELIKEFIDKPHLGIKISFIFYDQADFHEQGLYNVKVTNDITKIQELINKKRIFTVVLTEDIHKSDELRSYLFNCLHLKVDFISLPHFYEKITGKIPVESINQMWFLENLKEGGKLWYDKIKKATDLILAFFILIITFPFWPIISLIIKLENPGPSFYQQTRVGKNNKIFNLIKFRSMVHDPDASLRPTVARDARITKFGSFLRRTRIDELPQILNIIKGEMSFIGPRPERPELIEYLQKKIPFYNERTLVLPGITGWDQVCGEYHSPSKEDTLKKLQYDLYYVKNRSIFLDLLIVLKTIRTVLGRGGQ